MGRESGSKWHRAVLGIVLAPLLLHPAETPAAGDPLPLPEGVKLVLHMDLDRLRDSDLYQEAAEHVGMLARSDEKLQMFLAATGLADMSGSIRSFTLYSFADETRPQSFAGVVGADFPDQTMRRLEKAYAPVAREVGGHVIMPVIQTADVELVMSFLGDGELSFGTADAVEMVVDRSKESPELVAARSRTEIRRPIWGLIDARGVVEAALRAGEASGGNLEVLGALKDNPAIHSIKAIGFSVDIGKDIFFELRALTADDDSARLLADAAKGLLALGQMGVSQARDPDLYELLRQIVAEADRDGMVVSFTVGPNQIERLRAIGDPVGDLIP
ncbi:MAG: hypothetical protein ACE5IK_00810 [Acidobacteriota bacterium]